MTRDYRLFRKKSVMKERISFSGAVHPAVLFSLFVFFLSGVGYLYALNKGMVEGLETKGLEREISELRDENKRLRLSEAERLSLSRIEALAKERDMRQPENVKTLEEHGSIALK